MKHHYALSILATILFSAPGFSTAYSVNSLAITNTGSGNSGTLLYCITQANMSVGPHVLSFSVAGTIAINNPSGLLPTITQAVTIDGTTAPGYAGSPVVILDGTGLTNGGGLSVTAANFRIYGIDINNFAYWGLQISGDNADNFIIGASGMGNVIRNNDYYGIQITSADNGKIAFNKIGTDPTGNTCAANLYDGIDLNTGANNDSIYNNQISCNGYNGIQINASNNNVVRGNLIGPLLSSCTGSGYRGVDIEAGSTGNIVGGPLPVHYNKIAGNLYWGIEVKQNGTNNNLLQGNSYSCNDYGAIDVNTGANNGITPPVISVANATTISGTSLPNAIVEVFKSMNTNASLCPSMPLNQGVDYLGAATANGTGNWTLSGSFNGYVTATQRDGALNTSEFSTSVYTGIAGTLANSCNGNVLVGLKEQTEISFSIYPNPASASFFIHSNAVVGPAQITLMNMLGEIVHQQSATASELSAGMEILLTQLVSGIYFVQMEQSGNIHCEKLIVK